MSAKHTPAPWVALPPMYPDSPFGVFYRNANGHVIATTARAEDAALIAAAPGMLAGLERAEHVMTMCGQFEEANIVRAIIAKAKGES